MYNAHLPHNFPSEKKAQGFQNKALDEINDFICCCREHHDYVLIVKYTLCVPWDYKGSVEDGNEILNKFMEDFTKNYRHIFHIKESQPNCNDIDGSPLYFWAENKEDDRRIDYHLVMALDGDRPILVDMLDSYVYTLWNSYFSEICYCHAPLFFGRPGMPLYHHYDELFRDGGLLVNHSDDQATIATIYSKLYSALSFYANVHGRIPINDPGKNLQPYGKSLSIPNYIDETIEDVARRVSGRNEEESEIDSRCLCPKSINLYAVDNNRFYMVTRNSRDVIYWTTKCSTYVLRFSEDKTYYDGCNGPDVLIAEGPGISDPYFVNIAQVDPESVNKRSVYVGFIYGELVEITIKPISGKISFKIDKKRATRFIKELKEKGFFGGIAY